MASTPQSRARLETAGLRITRQRLAVLDSLHTGEHLDVDVIAERARAELGSISTQAVYDVLRVLTTAELVRRIEPAGKPALFEARVSDNHHHLVCRRCGAVADVDCSVGAAPCLDVADDLDFAVDEAEVVFWGVCAPCRVQNQKTSIEATAEEATV